MKWQLQQNFFKNTRIEKFVNTPIECKTTRRFILDFVYRISQVACQNVKKIFFTLYFSTNVNAPKDFEWGYRRGNDPEHFREEYLSQKGHTFKAKVRITKNHYVKVIAITSTFGI